MIVSKDVVASDAGLHRYQHAPNCRQRPAAGPRLQNPHMHLLEAASINLKATGDAACELSAHELVTLFRSHFFDERQGTRTEHLIEPLEPASGDVGRIIEPGQHFEWAWLLAWCERLTGRRVGTWAIALVDFADRHDVAPLTGATLDPVRNDGLALDRSERVWPEAERIQAAVATRQLTGRDPSAVQARRSGRLLGIHLAHRPEGAWIDHVDGHGRSKVEAVPASKLDHLMISFTKLLLMAGDLGGARTSQADALAGQ